MSKRYQCQFCQIKVGATFYKNGNTYKKMSTKTAHLIEYDRRFYFTQKEYVETLNINDVIREGA